jgi:hypothetical protein
MKSNLISNLRLPFLLFVFTACSTGRITISVLEPAQITIPSTIQRVSLFPGAGIPDPPGTFDSINELDLNPEYNYNRAKRGYMEGVYEIISASPRFKKIVLSDTGFENLLTTGVLSWDELRQLCIHDSTDAVLLLKKAVSIDSSYYFDKDSHSALEYRIIDFTKWAFYEPFTESSSVELKLNDTSYFEHDIVRWITNINPGDVPALLYDACYKTGNTFGKMICPEWNDHILRILFSGPGKPLNQAYYLARHDQWHQAGAIWNDLANSANVKVASRASFNQALAWELDDDIEQAVLWISYADSLKHTKKTKAYRQVLELRLKNKAELDLQMSGK